MVRPTPARFDAVDRQEENRAAVTYAGGAPPPPPPPPPPLARPSLHASQGEEPSSSRFRRRARSPRVALSRPRGARADCCVIEPPLSPWLRLVKTSCETPSLEFTQEAPLPAPHLQLPAKPQLEFGHSARNL
eukprot:jgi/Tetstr1/438960/TSEL_027454.t1